MEQRRNQARRNYREKIVEHFLHDDYVNNIKLLIESTQNNIEKILNLALIFSKFHVKEIVNNNNDILTFDTPDLVTIQHTTNPSCLGERCNFLSTELYLPRRVKTI